MNRHMLFDNRWCIEWHIQKLPAMYDESMVFHKARIELWEDGQIIEIREKSYKNRGSARMFNARHRAKMKNYIYHVRDRLHARYGVD